MSMTMIKDSRVTRVSFAVVLLLVLLPFSPAFAVDSRPIIGISIDNGDGTGEEATKLGMINQVQLAGGIPIIFNDRGDRSPEKDIQHIDGLIVQGNAHDIDPALYGQKKHKETWVEEDKTRSEYESKIIREALQSKVPVLLICGGMQRANVLMGGSLHQHIPDLPGVKPGHGNNKGNPPDVPSITVQIAPDSNMEKILGQKEIAVNSFHHQALDKIGSGFRVVGYSDAYTKADGSKGNLVEAIEADPSGQFAGQFIMGLQFHPEVMPGNPLSIKIFNAFTEAAQKFAMDTRRTHPDEEVLRRLSHNWKEAPAAQ